MRLEYSDLARVEKSALIAFSDQQMFDLVKDVARYREFLPMCSDSELLSEDEHHVCGRIEVAKAGFKQSFSTCNRIQPPGLMEIELKEGPFRKLTGNWEFIALREDACKIQLTLNFEFSGKLITVAFGKIFEQVANMMVESFCKRAHEVYGE